MKIQLQSNLVHCQTNTQNVEKQVSNVNGNVSVCLPYDVKISDEGYGMYRKSLNLNGLNQSGNIDRIDKNRELAEYMNKSIVDITGTMESEFYSRFKNLNTDIIEESGECSSLNLAKNCLQVYTDMYNEIKQGYANGEREIWVADSTIDGGFGFRKTTEEEELAALDSAFEFYSMVVKGHTVDRKIVSQKLEEIFGENEWFKNQRNVIESKNQESQEVDRIYERILNAAKAWRQGYSVDGRNLSQLFNQIFEENFNIA